jgi:biotin transport system substrate-specific component
MYIDARKVKMSVVCRWMTASVRALLIAWPCSLAILLASYARVPFYPVPFTMQTLAVLCVSLFANRRHAFLSLLLFVAMRGVFFPTGGYILGFFAIPFIIGNNAEKLSNARLLCRIFCSNLVVLAVGTAVLACFTGLRIAFVGGFLFFVPAEIFKGLLAFVLVRTILKFPR